VVDMGDDGDVPDAFITVSGAHRVRSPVVGTYIIVRSCVYTSSGTLATEKEYPSSRHDTPIRHASFPDHGAYSPYIPGSRPF